MHLNTETWIQCDDNGQTEICYILQGMTQASFKWFQSPPVLVFHVIGWKRHMTGFSQTDRNVRLTKNNQKNYVKSRLKALYSWSKNCHWHVIMCLCIFSHNACWSMMIVLEMWKDKTLWRLAYPYLHTMVSYQLKLFWRCHHRNFILEEDGTLNTDVVIYSCQGVLWINWHESDRGSFDKLRETTV